MAGIQIDGVNNKIDFDDDLDTSISANTDDTLVIEAGGNTMATITATTFTINDGTTITTADNTDTLSLISTDEDALVGPVLRLFRNSASPADDDVIGNLIFSGQDGAGNETDFLTFQVNASDVANGAEDGFMRIMMPVASTSTEFFRMNPAGFVFNESSVDMDFRVESNGNTHMLFVDGGSNIVGIGADPDLGVGLHIKSADSGGSATSTADELVVEGSGDTGIQILSGASSEAGIAFGDSGDSNIGLIGYDHANNRFRFKTNDAVQWYLDSSGNWLPAATDHGIYLGVTSATASNLLDDYEEGTWTPANAQVSLSIAGTPKYTKIGRFVFIHAYINWPVTSDSNQAVVTGLPFAAISGNNYSYASGRVGGQSSFIAWQMGSGASTLTPYNEGDGVLSNANLSNEYVLLSGSYMTD